MTRLHVQDVSFCPAHHSYIVRLAEVDGEEIFPIFVSPEEAQQIALLLHEIPYGHPYILDSEKRLIEAMGLRPKSSVIYITEERIYARFLLGDGEDEENSIDLRPVKAIALALKMNAPIFLERRPPPSHKAETKALPPKSAKAPGPLEALDRRLREAIDREDYEEAARLRDEIRALRGGHGQSSGEPG